MIWFTGGLLLVMAIGWGALFVRSLSSGKYSNSSKMVMEGLRLQKLAPPMLYLLDLVSLTRKFPIFFFKIQRAIQKICGDRRSGDYTLLFLAEMLSYSWILLTSGCLLSLLLGGDDTLIIIGAVLAVILPVALINDLHRKVVKREHEVLMELPELLNKIILLVGAGSTVQQAIKQCLERKREEESQNHPLYRELFQMQRELESGDSFQQALEGFSKRCGIQEVSAFSTSVLLNFRRGGNDFALALRELSRSLWEKRKSVSRTLGEQASSKLMFPMMLLFVVIVVLVGAPAFMIMDL